MTLTSATPTMWARLPTSSTAPRPNGSLRRSARRRSFPEESVTVSSPAPASPSSKLVCPHPRTLRAPHAAVTLHIVRLRPPSCVSYSRRACAISDSASSLRYLNINEWRACCMPYR